MVFERKWLPQYRRGTVWEATSGARFPPFATNKGMRGSNQKTAPGLSATTNMIRRRFIGNVRRGVNTGPKRMVGCIAEMGEC